MLLVWSGVVDVSLVEPRGGGGWKLSKQPLNVGRATGYKLSPVN